MADGGEIAAIFRGLAENAAQAGEDIGRSLERFYTDTAERANDSVNAVLNADGASADLINGVRVRLDDEAAGTESGSGSQVARMLRGEPVPAPGRALFNSAAKVTNREIMESGAGLPRTAATVEDIARRAGVNLEGTTVHIVGDADGDYVRYLDSQGACACAPIDRPGQIDIGPASFIDEETLAATLAHEQTHVMQYRAGLAPSSADLPEMERQAYAAEAPALARLRESRR